jgi:sugar phosphate isomerase/epimerase
VARILGAHGLRFGLEYVGPKTSWAAKKHPFVHTLAGTRKLIAAIGEKNVGVVLDSWHWYTAHETAADLATLTDAEIVAVDLNDAPAGIPVDEQVDSRRELPAATGVIDVAGFLTALNRLGCSAPVRAEPFNAALRAMPPEAALAATAAAMKKAFASIEGGVG